MQKENTLICTCDTNKVKKRLIACKKVGMKIIKNPITLTTVATYKGETVISCQQKKDNQWELKYNLTFWEEVDVVPDNI